MISQGIVAGGVTHSIRFGQSALYLLEQELIAMEAKRVSTGAPARVQEIRIPRGEGKVDVVTMAVEGLDLLRHLPNSTAIHLLLWAGLESARIKENSRANAFTIHEVGDLIDEAGGIENVSLPVMKAYAAAFPKRMTPEFIAQLDAQEKNAQGEESSTGTRSSLKRAKPKSE